METFIEIMVELLMGFFFWMSFVGGGTELQKRFEKRRKSPKEMPIGNIVTSVCFVVGICVLAIQILTLV